jgi:Tol biopolymer transport system component
VPLPTNTATVEAPATSTLAIENPASYIAFLSDQHYMQGLYLMTPDGNNVTKLRGHVSQFAWAPDGKQIAFASWGSSRILGIYIADTETGDIRRLTDDGTAPSWSPDGNRIAFISKDRRLAVINVNGGPRRYLTDLGFPAEFAHSLDDPAQWSPDGNRLLFAVSPNIYLVDANGGEPVLVVKSEYRGQPPSLAPSAASGNPVWSPDGKHFAFVSLRDDPSSGFHIYIADADGSNQTRLTDPAMVLNASSPAWSPDGARIAFTNFYGIYVINADGSHLLQLTDKNPDSKPSWSPNGMWIAFEHDFDIHVLSIAGIHLRNISNSEWRDSNPVWSPLTSIK